MTENTPATGTEDLVFEAAPTAVSQARVEAVSEDANAFDLGPLTPPGNTAATGTEAGEESLTGTPVSNALPTWTYDPAAAPDRVAASASRRAAAQPMPTATPASLGIMGRHRMPAVVVVLSIVTLGLYCLIWHARVNREMSDFDTRMHVRPGRSTWAVALPWLVGVAATVYGALLVATTQTHVSLPWGIPVEPTKWILLGGIVAVPYLVFVIPFSVIAIVMTAERVRVCEDRIGLTTDVQVRPAAISAWLLFPILGGVILVARLQSRLNGVWERVAPPASSRRRS